MSGFNHAIAGGSGKLIVTALQSPNYDPATNSGWTINKDGSATFFSVSLPGVATGTKVTFSSTAPPSPGVNDVWYDTAAGLVAQVWNGTAWVPFQIGTGAIANGAITGSLIQAGTIIAGVVNGTTIEGSFFVGNGTDREVMLYNGTPTLGNLLLSVSSGFGTDPFGNSYKDGFATYGPNAGSAQIVANAGTGQPFVILSPPSTSHVVTLPQMFASAANAGLANEFCALHLNSGTEGANGGTNIDLFSQTNDGTGTPQIQMSVNGALVLQVQPSAIVATVPVTAIQPGTGSTETWHNMTLANSWANNGSFGVARYRYVASPPNSVEIDGVITNGAAGTFFTLPGGYRPGSAKGYAIGATGGVTTGASANVRCDTSGNLSVSNVTTFTGNSFFIHGYINLDA